MNTPFMSNRPRYVWPFLCCIAVCLFSGCVRIQADAADRPLMVKPGPHLLIDDYYVDSSEGLTRTMHQPERLPQPVIAKGEVWHQQPLFFLTVQYDAPANLFKIWYNVKNPGRADCKTAYAYAESHDGVHWDRRPLGIASIEGSTDNNLFFAFGSYRFGMALFDDGERESDPARRYKMAFDDGGILAAFSPDGQHFTMHPNKIADFSELGDIIDGCWDPIRERYIICAKYHSTPEDGYKGGTENAKEGYRRLVGQTTSTDFINWSQPRRIVAADPEEPGVWEFYGMVPRVRGDLYLGFLRILRDDLPADSDGSVKGIGWTELCTSRDGENWTRHRERPFLDRNPQPGTWDRANAWFGDIVTVGNQEYIYYGGYSAGHKVGDRQIGLARLRRNGFVSRDAEAGEGRLVTPPLRLDGRALTVNANVRGKLRVRLLDATGRPLKGYDMGEDFAIRSDSVEHPVIFADRQSLPRHKTVRLEFILTDGELYGFDLVD